ncbi:hypothetical protein S726_005141 [Salmonella enterica subsp. enterica]|nr:hypothetical protein [Salmonella enterica subsp. enterica]
MNLTTKKLAIALAACSVFTGINVASAAVTKAPVTLNFSGTIKDSTCNLIAQGSDGSDLTTTGVIFSDIDAVNGGDSKRFKLVTDTAGGCAAVNSGTVEIMWGGAGLTEKGFTDNSGGTNALLQLTPQTGDAGAAPLATDSAVKVSDVIKTGVNTVSYQPTTDTTEYDYLASLVKADGEKYFSPGEFTSAVTYTVTYK